MRTRNISAHQLGPLRWFTKSAAPAFLGLRSFRSIVSFPSGCYARRVEREQRRAIPPSPPLKNSGKSSILRENIPRSMRDPMKARPASPSTPRLTSLSHGGGCGCKISPGVLSELLQGALPGAHYPDLLVGADTSDDAAVYRLNDDQAIVATTDFFMPIVDDPFDFGRIAATNALSDIYAMGARPLLALAIVGMPINTLSRESIRDILRGGE